MDKIEFKMQGFDDVYKKLAQLSDKARGEVKNEFAASANNIRNNAIRLAPVNLGELRNSIKVISRGDNNDYVFIVRAGAKYAPYVEFGTGGKVSVPSNYQQYAQKFKGKTGSTFKAMIEALALWVKRKGIGNGKNDKGLAYAIALNILRKGLRPQPFLIPSYEQEIPKLIKNIKQIVNA